MGSAMQYRDQVEAANRQNEANQKAFERRGIEAMQAFELAGQQRATQLMQSAEAWGQKMTQIGVEAWKAAGSLTPGSDTVAGPAAHAAALDAFMQAGKAAAAGARQQEADEAAFFSERGIDALKVEQRRREAIQPWNYGPSAQTALVMGLANALNAYTTAKAGGFGETWGATSNLEIQSAAAPQALPWWTQFQLRNLPI